MQAFLQKQPGSLCVATYSPQSVKFYAIFSSLTLQALNQHGGNNTAKTHVTIPMVPGQMILTLSESSSYFKSLSINSSTSYSSSVYTFPCVLSILL